MIVTWGKLEFNELLFSQWKWDKSLRIRSVSSLTQVNTAPNVNMWFIWHKFGIWHTKELLCASLSFYVEETRDWKIQFSIACKMNALDCCMVVFLFLLHDWRNENNLANIKYFPLQLNVVFFLIVLAFVLFYLAVRCSKARDGLCFTFPFLLSSLSLLLPVNRLFSF